MSRRRPSGGPARVAALAWLLGLPMLLACTGMSVQRESQVGARMARETQGQLPMIRDRVLEAYVADVAGDILEAAGPQPFAYRFYVVDDPDINAFAMPGGHVYVHSGTIRAARNVSELAGVLAHEIGHVHHRHIAENMARQQWVGAAGQAAVIGSAVVGAPTSLVGMAADLGSIGLMNSFGREAEREADSFAVVVMARAGYDPQGLVTFFQTLLTQGGSGAPSFLSSHPATTERIDATRRQIDALPDRHGLRTDDDGKLAIIQRRLEILTASGRR